MGTSGDEPKVTHKAQIDAFRLQKRTKGHFSPREMLIDQAGKGALVPRFYGGDDFRLA